jgi:geranylgeranyl pyrophosphate synthase
MLHQRPAELLKEEIKDILSSLKEAAGLGEILEETLDQSPPKTDGLSDGEVSWALLPLWVCEAISGRFEQAIPVAASLQLLRAAAEVFDDLEDADSSHSLAIKYGPALAINTASTLLILAEKAIPRLKAKGVDNKTIIRVMDIINSYCTTACTGQYLDLSVPPEKLSEDDYFKIACMKSAWAIECACHTGALLAGAKQELIDKMTKFGYNLGIMAQIANDLEGIKDCIDIQRRRLTLPAIYALAQTEGEHHKELELAFVEAPTSKSEPARIRELLFKTGAVYYTKLKIEIYKQAAQKTLLEAEKCGANIEHLKLFLE